MSSGTSSNKGMSRVLVAFTAALAATTVNAAAIRTIYPPVGPVNGTLGRRQLFGHIPSTVGRLEIHFDAVDDKEAYDSFCTGSTVNTPTKNIVVTAAHCVHREGYGFPSRVVFKPGFDDGNAPFGEWYMDWTTTLAQFKIDNPDGVQQELKSAYDQAVFEMAPRDGVNVVDAVGGNGLKTGWTAGEQVTAWGYPGVDPYKLNRAVKCHDSTTLKPDGDASLPCEMNGGSSGGPWFLDLPDGADVGWVVGLTSKFGPSMENPIRDISSAKLPQEFVDLVHQKGGF